MPAYSFQPRFIEPIVTGTKGGTIRAPRRPANRGIHTVARQKTTGGHAYVGEELALYTGMRTRQCQLIGRRRCIATVPIHILLRGDAVAWGDDHLIDQQPELDMFARFDGFGSWDDLLRFWYGTHGYIREFEGWHIRWLPLPQPAVPAPQQPPARRI